MPKAQRRVKALLWLVGLAMALALLKVAMQTAFIILALALLASFAKAPRETFAVLCGLLLMGLFVNRPELGLWLFTVLMLASRPWKK